MFCIILVGTEQDVDIYLVRGTTMGIARSLRVWRMSY